MGLAKGKTNNPAGRPAGKPNRLTTELKTWIKDLVEKNKVSFERDLRKLDPKDRLVILERLMQYVIPKMQTVSIEEQIKHEYQQLETLLNECPDEVIDELFERMKKLKDEQGKKN